MKKLITVAACVMLAAATQAAAVGWSAANLGTTSAGDAYNSFIIGQNGAESVAFITALLDAGSDVSSYAFAEGKVAAAGGISQAANSTSGKTLGTGTYTGFFVVFDNDTPAAGSSNYAVISGVSTLTRSVGDSTASVAFAGGNAASFVTTDKWKSFGTSSGGVPEPTSGLLLLVGAGMLALRRKQK